MLQNYLAGASQRYTLRFGLDGALAPNAYVEFTVSEFDAYSYLFCSPVLNSAGLTGFSVQTIRISVNGVAPVASQSFRMLNTAITQESTRLSEQCQVVPKDLGADQDVFHIFFDTLGPRRCRWRTCPACAAASGRGLAVGGHRHPRLRGDQRLDVGADRRAGHERGRARDVPELIRRCRATTTWRRSCPRTRWASRAWARLLRPDGREHEPARPFFGVGFDWTQTDDVREHRSARSDHQPARHEDAGTGLANQPTAAEVRPHRHAARPADRGLHGHVPGEYDGTW
jgi:hypothetical protein